MINLRTVSPPLRYAPWLVLLMAAAMLAACLDSSSSPPSSPFTMASTTPFTENNASAPLVPQSGSEMIGEATLLAFGDVMVHMPQLPAYYDAASQRYDFSAWFDRVAPIFRTGDWVVGNLETPVAGAELKYTGFPRFNAPTEIAEALYGAGVGLVSTANNHAMDRGFAGVLRTLRNVRNSGLMPVGTAGSKQDSERLTIIERHGIRMGFLAYTYGTNGMPVPKDKPFAVEIIDPKRMADDIRQLREAGTDIVTVSLHFGIEYQRMPNEEQQRITRSAIGSGADIVLGSHSHVVQPYNVIEVPATESVLGKDRKGVVIYSLGNFISNQTGDWKDVGVIFGVHLIKTRQVDGSISTAWDRITTIPTWVHIYKPANKRYYTVLPIRQTIDEHNDPTLTEADYTRLGSMLDQMETHLHTFQQP